MTVIVTGLGAAVAVGVGVGEGRIVAVGVGVGLGVGLGIIVALAVGVGVGEAEIVGVAVGVGVEVGNAVGVGDGDGSGSGGVTVAGIHAENSDVLLFGSVAVAVTTFPAPTGVSSVALICAMQSAPVVTSVAPRKTAPSPLPEVSQTGLAKNSTRYVEFATESRVPVTVVTPLAELAEVNTG